MARPTKQGIEYFSLDVDFFSDIKVRRISKACGPASTSILICLLCNIGITSSGMKICLLWWLTPLVPPRAQ
ncbi:DUF4373 domain-containing protein [Bacteroides fragilis]|nr:DUF4373 domain-containing protein [Bacteroides fragilis]